MIYKYEKIMFCSIITVMDLRYYSGRGFSSFKCFFMTVSWVGVSLVKIRCSWSVGKA